MEVNISKQGEAAIVQLNGRLDANTSGDVESQLIPVFDSGEKKVVIDFSRLDYISSAGLRVLLLAAKKSKALNSDLKLSGLKPHVKEVFDIAGFSTIFSIYETNDDAVNAF